MYTSMIPTEPRSFFRIKFSDDCPERIEEKNYTSI